MGEPLLAAPPTCSALCWNANIQLSEEKYNLARNTEEQPWIPVRAARFFCWLVHPRGLRNPRSSKRRKFRNHLWYHRRYQQALGNCRTHTQVKNYFELLRHGRMCGPKGGFADLTCMKWQDRQWEQITIAALLHFQIKDREIAQMQSLHGISSSSEAEELGEIDQEAQGSRVYLMKL